MQEALAEAIEMINSSKQPVVIAGVEIHRFGLQNKLLQLIAKTNIPVVATVLSKSVISEDHPFTLEYTRVPWDISQLENMLNLVTV